MFGIKKSFLPISDYPDDWAILEADNAGSIIMVRKRTGLDQAAGHTGYPFQIGIAIPVNNIQEQQKDLQKIEDSLCTELTSDNTAVLAAVITTPEMREFVIYASEWKPEEYEQQVKKVNARFANYELQFMMQRDPKWSTFKSFS